MAYGNTPSERGDALATAVVGEHPLRAVSYLRVSTRRQVSGYGLAKAERSATRHMAAKGWEHVGTFVDPGVSGANGVGDRPDFDRLMRFAGDEPRPFDVVVVEEGRAIGRTGRAFWRWVWSLEDLGIFVAIVDGDVDNTTPEGCRELRRQARYAEREWEVVRARAQGGLQEKAMSGGWVGGPPPYGYRIAKKGVKGESHLVLDKAEARVLRRAKEVLVKEQPNWRRTAFHLNAEGFRDRRGNPWTEKTLKRRLLSESTLESRIVFRNPARVPSSRGTVLKSDGIPEYGESVVIPLDPIFSPREVAELRCHVAALPPRRPGARRVYPLSGRLFGACGRHYVGAGRTGSNEHWYKCSGKDEKYPGADVCSCVVIDAPAIEKAVWGEVLKLASGGGLDIEDRAIPSSGAVSGLAHSKRIAALGRQIEVQRSAISAVVESVAGQALSDDGCGLGGDIDQAIGVLREELGQLVRLWGEAVAWREEAADIGRGLDGLRKLSSSVRGELPGTSLREQDEVLALLSVRVEMEGPVRGQKVGAPCLLTEWFRSRGRSVPLALSDEDWAAVEPLMKGRPRGGCTYRLWIDAAFHKARTGIRWDELPVRYGKSVTIHTRVSRWIKSGLWTALMAKLPSDDGAALPDKVPVPPLKVTGRIDPRLLLGHG